MTVTHDSERDLVRLLAGVARHLPGARVVVVDSGSRDGGVAAARAWTGDATIVELANVGFGRRRTPGWPPCARPRAPCSTPTSSCRRVARGARGGGPAARRPRAAARPARARRPTARGRTRCTASRHAAAALTALVPPAALPAALRRRVQPWRAAAPRPRGRGPSAARGRRDRDARALGPFDEGIFLYGEDLELGLRARDRGRDVVVAAARVVHHGAHAARRAFGGEPFELLARQRRAVVAERRGARAARADDARSSRPSRPARRSSARSGARPGASAASSRRCGALAARAGAAVSDAPDTIPTGRP